MGDSLVAEQPDSTDAITYNPIYGTLLIGQHPSKGIVYVPLAAHLDPATDDIDPAISNPTRQEWDAAKSDPAMEGDAVAALLVENGNTVCRHQLTKMVNIDLPDGMYLLYPSKRVQPASMEDAEGPGYNIDAAAEVLAACMDYPWDQMPEQGRSEMRKHAKSVVDAAMQQGGQS